MTIRPSHPMPPAASTTKPADSAAATLTGRVEGLAIRTARKGPMRELTTAMVEVDSGIVGNTPVQPRRGLTFLDAEQWAQTTAELGTSLPWHTRRANILTRGIRLASLMGGRISIGTEVEVEIFRETRPCAEMDEQHMGLQKALEPDCRGGVYGRVLQGGNIAVGDVIAVVRDQHNGASSA